MEEKESIFFSLGDVKMAPKEQEVWEKFIETVKQLKKIEAQNKELRETELLLKRSLEDVADEETFNSGEWNMSTEFYEVYKKLFSQIDDDKDGFISAAQAIQNKIFAPTQKINVGDLANIWILSDIDKDGKLNCEEFALSQFLLDAKATGKEIPAKLPKSLLPEKLAMRRTKSLPTDLSQLEHSNENVEIHSPSKRVTNSFATLRPKSSYSSTVQVPSKNSNRIPIIDREKINRDLREYEKKHKHKLEKEQRIRVSIPFWEDILNTWPSKRNLPKTKQMWWHGIPPSLRGRVWEVAINNDLNITKELFDIFAKHAMKARDELEAKNARRVKIHQSQYQSSLSSNNNNNNNNNIQDNNNNNNNSDNNNNNNKEEEEDSSVNGKKEEKITISPSWSVEEQNIVGRESSVQLIPLDLHRTFPMLSFFSNNGPYELNLRTILEAYVCFRPDIGYVQGMSFIGAVLLLNMDTFPAFKCLANLLNRTCYLAFYKLDMSKMRKYMDMFEVQMSLQLPKVYSHLRELGIAPEIYLMDWVLTIFSKSLPLDVAVRVWDVYILEGDYFIFRCSLGILKYFSHIMEAGTFDEIVYLLTHLPPVEEEKFFLCIEKIDPVKLKKAFDDVNTQVTKSS